MKILTILGLQLSIIFASTCTSGTYKSDVKSVYIDLNAYVDNYLTLYAGNETQALKYLGSGSLNIGIKATLTTEDYIYIVAWSDLIGWQGISIYLYQAIEGLQSQYITSSQDSWTVSATNRRNYAPKDSSASSFSELNAQIALSNTGNSASKGWATPSGARNFTTTMGSQKFIWYSSNGVVDPTLTGYNHQEYLIFRMDAGYGYDKICYPCKYGQYCLGEYSSPQRCPFYQSTNKYGSSSSSDCQVYPKAILINLNKVTNPPLYEVSFTLPNLSGFLHFIAQCDNTYKTQLDCFFSNLLVTLTFSDCSETETIQTLPKNISSDSPQSVYVDNSQCTQGKFKSSHNILNMYFESRNSSLSESYVQATQNQEYHKRFFLYDNYNIAYNVLKFDSPINQSIQLNYSPGQYSSEGTANGDYFSFEDPYRYTVLYLTNQKDVLKVQDTVNQNNNSATIPTFFLLDGNDNATCYTHCNLYGGEGNNTYQIIGNTNMVIYDFNTNLDVINLKYTHPSIKRRSALTYLKTNSSTIKITFSNTQSLTLYPVTGDINSINFVFQLSCASFCKECTLEDQCEGACNGCGYCNSTQCLWCNSTSYLQEGKCVEECDEEYTINPLNNTQCKYCNSSNCLECSESSFCYNCDNNYIPVNGTCQRCNVTYYSVAGNRKCSKCGDGCDYCNKTHCLTCTQGYLYAPKLSTQICYRDLSCAETSGTYTKQLQANSFQSQLITNGILINADGTQSQINYSIKDINADMLLDQIQVQKYLNQNNYTAFYSIDESSSKRMLADSTTIKIRNVPLLIQTDDKWKNEPYAGGKLTIGSKGCLLTSHAMILQSLKFKVDSQDATPKNINDWLVKNNGYSGLGIVHATLDKLTPYTCIKCTEANGEKYPKNIFDYFRKDYIVFLNVKRKSGTMHWVVMVGISEDEKSVYVRDPGYVRKTEDVLDNIRYAHIYKMKSASSTQPIKQVAVNKIVYTDDFQKSDLNYNSCYKYSKDNTNSQHYKDVQKIINKKDLNQFQSVNRFTQIVHSSYPKIPTSTKICNQKNSIWSLFKSVFGITDGYDSQSFEEEGSQLCSLSMVLETFGKKDENKQYYFPDSIDDILQDNSAYKKKERTKMIFGKLKYLSTMNQIDFDIVKENKLFGLTDEITEVSNSNMQPLSKTIKDQIILQFNTGGYLFIFEVIDDEQLDTYYVFSLNKIENNQVLVNDPTIAQQRLIPFSRITGYIRFKSFKIYNAPQLKDIHSIISGIPHQHVVLTYKQESLKAGRLPDKRYYLTKWVWTTKNYFNYQTFTAIDTATSQEFQISPLLKIAGNQYNLNTVDVYINKEYLLDTKQLVTDQSCSQKEIMAFVRMNQHSYTNSQGKTLQCFDNSISSSQCPLVNNERTCSVDQCKGYFNTQLSPIETSLKKQTGFPTTSSRYCSLAKFSYLSGTTEILSDSALVKNIQDKKFYRAAYSIYAKKSTCLMKPRQAEELFQGLYHNKSPKITNTATKIDKGSVLSKLIEIVGTQTQFQKKAQYTVSQAIITVLSLTKEVPQTEQNTEDFGIWLESKGYLRSDLKLDQTLAGDIVVFKGGKEYPFGHAVIKSQTAGEWYSDHKQTKECIFTYTSYIVYN